MGFITRDLVCRPWLKDQRIGTHSCLGPGSIRPCVVVEGREGRMVHPRRSDFDR